MTTARRTRPKTESSTVTDYRSDLWKMADALRGSMDAAEDRDEYTAVPGFCKTATLEEIREHGHVLTRGSYVGVEPQPDDGDPLEEKITCLAAHRDVLLPKLV